LRLWYTLIVSFLLILIVVSYFLFRNFRVQKKLNMQQELIHLQNIEYLKSMKELELMQAMIEGEESERKRISRDLHDGIGSRLSSLKMQLDQLNLKGVNSDDYEKFSSNLNLVIKDLRQTAFNLVPETLFKLGLELALKDLCFTMSNTNVKILYTSNEIKSNILTSHQVSIFRIVQELINNALKHANCSEVLLDCSQNQELFLITVEDNGIGFNTSDLNCFTGLGLKNIKNRIDLLNGTVEARSTICKGTVFNIELKVKLYDEK
jgi:two-component system, NarL family, sensor kinase